MVNNDSNTVMAGLYVEHLKNWLDVFSIDQMHVMEGMELIRQPYREIKKVEAFLELPNVLRESNFYLNQTRGFYCPRPFYSRQPECLSDAKGVPHPKLRPEAQKLIYDFYRPYNEKLFQIIGKRFHWEPEEESE
ncbi:sulfotransferase [Plakobranchus ocellatus]|uniref:Sulfotransferase n=1 Tax=Plakobranchus ocellatus TaxID=259542 RepID=A0AAV4BNX0_9GAST|nr:sulfotransferase [Plakobranchus ocellatus]